VKKVKLRTGSHLDIERFSYKSEQRGAEVDGAITGYGHVHPDQLLQPDTQHLYSLYTLLV